MLHDKKRKKREIKKSFNLGADFRDKRAGIVECFDNLLLYLRSLMR